MTEAEILSVARVQQVLDKGFQKCLALAETMPKKIEKAFHGRLELIYIEHEELRNILRSSVNEFYQAMTETLFQVLRILQPHDFANGNRINFYFLPGYHSCLTNRRMFFREKCFPSIGGLYQNFGVGLCGDPDLQAPEQYYDCSHARWYLYATTPPRPVKDFFPASPYHWFAYQQPRISADPHDLVASLSFTMIPSAIANPDFPEHQILNLSEPATSSRDWGTKVKDMLNNMQHVRQPLWKFPDRGDRHSDQHFDKEHEGRLCEARCLLISLWMHSVFNSEQPDWLKDLFDELEKQELESVSASIRAALKDPVAHDWGDKKKGRPSFKTWTTIGLHPLVAPPPVRIMGPQNESVESMPTPSTIFRQTIGWATMLCSTRLDLPFISVARQWIRGVYGMLRTAEVAVLLKNRESLERAAQVVRALSHDTRKLIYESVASMLHEANSNSTEVVQNRRITLLNLDAQSVLSYGLSAAAADSLKAKRMHDDILKSLEGVRDNLVGIIYRVADEIQGFMREENCPKIKVPQLLSQDFEIPRNTYAICLLLIGEMVRNYCEHGPEGSVAELSATLTEHWLKIVLEGNTEKRPVGQAYALLDNILEILSLGEARSDKVSDNRYRWTVAVNFKKEPPL
jgi:hypothetical protein